MKLNRFGFCERYGDYCDSVRYDDPDLEEFESIFYLTVISNIIIGLALGVICSVGLLLPWSGVWTISMGVPAIFCLITNGTSHRNCIYDFRYILTSLFVNWPIIFIIDLLMLPLVYIVNYFSDRSDNKAFDRLIVGRFKQEKIQPFLLKPKHKKKGADYEFSNELVKKIAEEFVTDDIGRDLLQNPLDNFDGTNESVVVNRYVNPDPKKPHVIMVNFRINRMKKKGRNESLSSCQYFMTLTMDTDNDPAFVTISNVHFFGNNRQKSDIERGFEAYVDTCSDKLGIGYTPFNEDTLREMHDLGHGVSTTSLPAATAVPE